MPLNRETGKRGFREKEGLGSSVIECPVGLSFGNVTYQVKTRCLGLKSDRSGGDRGYE